MPRPQEHVRLGQTELRVSPDDRLWQGVQAAFEYGAAFAGSVCVVEWVFGQIADDANDGVLIASQHRIVDRLVGNATGFTPSTCLTVQCGKLIWMKLAKPLS